MSMGLAMAPEARQMLRRALLRLRSDSMLEKTVIIVSNCKREKSLEEGKNSCGSEGVCVG
jgi:spore coat polysaccharide biosynthesis protein SpsF (cytidylyltransferase family)